MSFKRGSIKTEVNFCYFLKLLWFSKEILILYSLYLNTYNTLCLQTWLIEIRRDVSKDFQITERTKICSLHFKYSHFRRHICNRCLQLKAAKKTFAYEIEAICATQPVRRSKMAPNASNRMVPRSIPLGLIYKTLESDFRKNDAISMRFPSSNANIYGKLTSLAFSSKI